MSTDRIGEETKKGNANDAFHPTRPVFRASTSGPFGLALLTVASAPLTAKEMRLDCGFPLVSGEYSSAFEIVIDYDARKVTMTSAAGVSEPLDANITDSTVSWAASQPMPGQAVRWSLDRYTGAFIPFYRVPGSATTSSGVPGKCFVKEPKL